MGGTSEEREVSLASGIAIVRALRERGHSVDIIDTARGFIAPADESGLLPRGVQAAPPERIENPLQPTELGAIPQLREADVAFLALHGGIGEDGTLQAFLEMLGVPYTGSGPLGSGIAMDKDVSKRLLRDAEVPTLPLAGGPRPLGSSSTTGTPSKTSWVIPASSDRRFQGSSVGLTVV